MKNIISKPNQKSGFTLIELLVVIGILVILLAVVLIAINPGRQFGQANNTKRRNDISAILNAVGSYAADKKGALPGGITTTATDVGTICSTLVTDYIPALPVDPTVNNGTSIETCGQTNTTAYNIVKDAKNRVTVSATVTDNGETISITR